MKNLAANLNTECDCDFHNRVFRKNLMDQTTHLMNRLLEVLHADLSSGNRQQKMLGQAAALAALSHAAAGKIPDDCQKLESF